jgi:hypothetical protein
MVLASLRVGDTPSTISPQGNRRGPGRELSP